MLFPKASPREGKSLIVVKQKCFAREGSVRLSFIYWENTKVAKNFILSPVAVYKFAMVHQRQDFVHRGTEYTRRLYKALIGAYSHLWSWEIKKQQLKEFKFFQRTEPKTWCGSPQSRTENIYRTLVTTHYPPPHVSPENPWLQQRTRGRGHQTCSLLSPEGRQTPRWSTPVPLGACKPFTRCCEFTWRLTEEGIFISPKEIGSENSHKTDLRPKIIFRPSHVNKMISLTDKHQPVFQEEPRSCWEACVYLSCCLHALEKHFWELPLFENSETSFSQENQLVPGGCNHAAPWR